MSTVRVTLRNYRCFDDESSVSVDIAPGFISLVGQNNSGKSSFLKLFFEIRNLLTLIGPNGNLINLLNGARESPSWSGLFDEQEVYCDNNNRPLEIQFELIAPVDTDPPQLTRIILSCERTNPRAWQGSFFVGRRFTSSKQFLPAGNNFQSFSDNSVFSGGKAIFDGSAMFDFARALSRSIYIGPFRNAINEGAGNYFDIAIGSSFVSTWHQWKAGDKKADNLAVGRVTQDVRHIFDFKSLEIDAATNMKTLQLFIDSKPYKLTELGAGLSQFIIVLANAMIRTPEYILIDEPELNLHPSLQIDFLTTLASYAKRGVIFASHSIGLARSVSERIYTFQRQNGRSKVTPFEQTPNYAEFLGEMSYASFKELGFDRILLVEGVKDVRTIRGFNNEVQL